MKPLIVITSYNRADELGRTLAALEETTDLHGVDLVVVDNGSGNGTVDMLCRWRESHTHFGNTHVLLLPSNIGCPRALNKALELYRQPGQPVVKLDNDVEMLTVGWVDKVASALARLQDWEGRNVAMIGANYPGVLEGRLLMTEENVGFSRLLHHVAVVIGHCVWHTGPFMDAVGYFDVLSPEHLYGFEDLLLSCKAGAMDWRMFVWEGWSIRNIQRHSALGRERQNGHVAQMRSLYNERRQAILAGETLWTGADGQPVTRMEEDS